MTSPSWTRRLIITLALLILVALGGHSGLDNSKPVTKKAIAKTINKYFDESTSLKILALTDFPSGRAFEVKQTNGPGYFLVGAMDGNIQYAIFEDIQHQDTQTKFGFSDAREIAKAWVDRYDLFSGYHFQLKQPDYNWPKRGYYTAVWSGDPQRNAESFGKVTVDLETGKVVSFGVGDPKWSMFCIPKKEIAP